MSESKSPVPMTDISPLVRHDPTSIETLNKSAMNFPNRSIT